MYIYMLKQKYFKKFHMNSLEDKFTSLSRPSKKEILKELIAELDDKGKQDLIMNLFSAKRS